ncbi:MAG: sugar ABC transporter ATP-binding protein [Spirochaetales bacterium]|nr:sugar ABC transporter ATP-binding protein [Spirochaetales bacterium]
MSNKGEIFFEIENVSKQFPGVQALENVDIKIKKNEILGLAGENGAGKSTMMKIIAGVYYRDNGYMRFNGEDYNPKNYREATSMGISMVFQEQNLVPNLFGYENIFLSHEEHFIGKNRVLNKKKMIERTHHHFDQFGLDANPTKPVASYSFHQRQLLEILRAFIISELYGIDSPLILLDEPTAALSEKERELLFSKIAEYSSRATFCLISHRLSEMMTHCDRIVVLKDGRNAGEVDPREASVKDLHSMMVGREFSGDTYQVSVQKDELSEKNALAVENLNHAGRYEDVSFSLKRGEILGIGGLVGCGKKELGKDVYGIEEFDSGRVYVGDSPVDKVTIPSMVKRKIGYIPAERKGFGIIEYLPVGWNLTLPSIFILKSRIGTLSKEKEKRMIEKYIDEFSIKAKAGDMCFSLSGGNQQKVVLAKWIARKLDILILDNPTRGIDVGAKEEIYSLMRAIVREGVSIIMITDDLLELIGLSNRIIIMKEGKITNQREAGKDNKPTEKELVQYMV